MHHIIVAVRDRQLNAFLRPFTAATRGQAIRAFSDEVNRPDSDLAKHPADYELYELGTFEETSGKLLPNEQPQQLALASNLIERK